MSFFIRSPSVFVMSTYSAVRYREQSFHSIAKMFNVAKHFSVELEKIPKSTLARPFQGRAKNFVLCNKGRTEKVKLLHRSTTNHFDKSIPRTASRTFSTNVGETESSSIPILKNVSVRDVSAPSSPQIPIQAPCL